MAQFVPSEGKTLITNEGGEVSLFADFSLKFVGEVHGRKAQGEHEGHWLASLTGFVFSQKITRLICLKGSDFDSKRSLLEAIRSGFPGGSVTFAPGIKNEQVSAFWHWLVSQYEPGSGVKVYNTDHLGAQVKDNYWILDGEIHLWKNSVVEEHERAFYLVNPGKLLPYSTQLNTDLLQKDVLLRSTQRLLEMATYLGVNYPNFLLALGFCLSRLLRSSKLDDTWGESNIGLVYSSTKNCGKSMVLYILAKFQGLGSRQHPLLVSGGNQGTSGTSAKKILETLSKTTLTVMLDDPLISVDLGEFLNQVQGGLIQGSTSSGVFAPKGSLLLTSNDKEVKRIEGRVQRFTFVKDEGFELDEQRETRLMSFVEDNKGLFIAWSMRYWPLWNDCVAKYIPLIQRAVRLHFPAQQIRWIRGIAYTILAKTMFLASANQRCNIMKTLEDLEKSPGVSKPILPALSRFQRAVFEKVQEQVGKAHTWINPFCTVKMANSGASEKAYAFAISTINLLNAEVNNKEISETLNQMVSNGVCQPVSFAVDANTPLPKLRKKDGDESITTKRAHKVPLCNLDPLFVAWVDYALGLMTNQPIQDFDLKLEEATESAGADQQPCCQVVGEINQLEETVLGLTSVFNKEQHDDANTMSKQSDSVPEFAENLSPSSRQEWSSFTPRRKHAFEMGFRAATKKAKTCFSIGTSTSPNDLDEQSPESTAIKETDIQFCSESKVETVRTATEPAKARKELFPEGAVGVLLSKETQKDVSKTSRKKKKTK